MTKKEREIDEMIKVCDEQIREINKHTFVHCDTIAQYKIMQWVNENFVRGSVSIDFTASNKAVIEDVSGATMNLAYNHIRGVYEDDEAK